MNCGLSEISNLGIKSKVSELKKSSAFHEKVEDR